MVALSAALETVWRFYGAGGNKQEQVSVYTETVSD